MKISKEARKLDTLKGLNERQLRKMIKELRRELTLSAMRYDSLEFGFDMIRQDNEVLHAEIVEWVNKPLYKVFKIRFNTILNKFKRMFTWR